MSPLERFSRLFQSYELAHGSFDPKGVDESGKIKGRAQTIHKPIDTARWEEHLTGSGPGVGGIALLRDNTLRWAAIDIDVKGIHLQTLAEQVKNKGWPLVVCRSKSGGAHCYIFTHLPIPAKTIRTLLMSWAAQLGHAGCEVFPKQVMRVENAQVRDVGNWINLPYYQGDKTERYAVTVDKEKLSLDEFLELAEKSRVDDADIAKFMEKEKDPKEGSNEIGERYFPGGPPCLKTIASRGKLGEGSRNNFLYNCMIYLRKQNPDGWKDDPRIMQYNQELIEKPLGLGEVNTTVKSVDKNTGYEYRCGEEPIKQFCNKSKCRQCPFGIGPTANSQEVLQISSITKVHSTPKSFFINLEDGTRFELDSSELLNPEALRRATLEATGHIPGVLRGQRYIEYMNQLLSRADDLIPPAEMTKDGKLHELILMFLNSKSPALKLEDVARNVPYHTEDGYVMFKTIALTTFLTRNRFEYSEGWLMERLKNTYKAESVKVNIGKTSTAAWKMLKPEELEVREIDLPTFREDEVF